jgi:hypothetical protein
MTFHDLSIKIHLKFEQLRIEGVTHSGLSLGLRWSKLNCEHLIESRECNYSYYTELWRNCFEDR